MFRLAAVLAFLVAASALPQPQVAEPIYEPKPYSFNYESLDDGGRHSHSQSSDGHKVTGQYELSDADGRVRVVEYVADEEGFRANIKTNEPGTDNSSPADVQLEANPIQVAEPVNYAKPVPVPVARPVTYAAAPRPVQYAAPAPRPVQYAQPQQQGRYVLVPYDQLGAYGYSH